MPWRVWVGGLGRKRLHCTLLSIGSRHGLHAHLKHDKLVVLSTRYLFVGHKRPASLDWCDFFQVLAYTETRPFQGDQHPVSTD